MGILGFLFGESEEIEVTVTNERNGETRTSIAANDNEYEECMQAYRDAGYTVIDEEESEPWWKFW